MTVGSSPKRHHFPLFNQRSQTIDLWREQLRSFGSRHPGGIRGLHRRALGGLLAGRCIP